MQSFINQILTSFTISINIQMPLRIEIFLRIIATCVLLFSTSTEAYIIPTSRPVSTEDYCQYESFKPSCQKNEAILMKSATYGRMRIGRCITAEEVAGFRPHFGDNPPNLGCSADVLSILDRKCSGKTECEIRLSDISSENIKPCFPILNVYLEVSYDCIDIADERRSCSVIASKSPIYIISSASASDICGTKSQPWIVEAPNGQRIRISLIDFASPTPVQMLEQSNYPCSQNYGVVVDKAGKRNVSICGQGDRRESDLHLSAGNAVHIVFHSSDREDTPDHAKKFALKIEAIGCSDIIPPEDTWLKRNNDSIVIGCYSSRQTWRLSCNEGNWIGVLGNCSQDAKQRDPITNMESKETLSKDEQVLAMVAIVGCTLAVCLGIVCIGAVCLRRFYAQRKKEREYKTFNFSVYSGKTLQHEGQLLGSDLVNHFPGTEIPEFDVQQVPVQSVQG